MVLRKKMEKNNLPSISVIIPTYNSGNILDQSLSSIIEQNYPKKLIEILIIDGGSIDNTIKIAKNYTNKIYKNPLKTGEAGKAIGVKKAKNELIALIDSDNILPTKDWFSQMVVPFIKDKEIEGSEPIEYVYRKGDGYINRYSALIGMNDVICLFLGNYDRFCYLTKKWTDLKVNSIEYYEYIKLIFSENDINKIPTIGANGTLFKKSLLDEINLGDYLFDIDIIIEKIINTGKPVIFAKVKTGIIHVFSNNLGSYIKKQKRRITDYNRYKELRKYKWNNTSKWSILKFIIYTVMLVPLIFQSLRGYFSKRDLAWFFHPLACIITLFIYSFGVICHYLKQKIKKVV